MSTHGYAYLIGDLPVNSSFRQVVRHIRKSSSVRQLKRSSRRAHYRGGWNALQGSLRDYQRMAGQELTPFKVFPYGRCTGNPCPKCGAWYSAVKNEETFCFGDQS